MARISIVSPEEALDDRQGLTRDGKTRAIFSGEKDPIHVYLHRMKRGEVLRAGSAAVDTAAYVWQGGVYATGIPLGAGSSLIVERAASLDIECGEVNSLVLTFAARQPSSPVRAGGNVHLLPTERVPRYGVGEAGPAVRGGLHADASCPTCTVWLHENSFAPLVADAPVRDPEAGIHAHTEDEVIFVVSGELRLGSRRCGPGTAISIAATTMYGFTPGPDGLSFVNFRADIPREIRFKSGLVMDEVGYWRQRVGTPAYISPPRIQQPRGLG
jgi:hypothetical protein